MSSPTVRVIREHRVLAEVPLTGTLAVGRLPDNDLVLDDELVSGHHGRIERTDAGWRYTDLGSTNGSIVAAGPTLRRGESTLLREDSQILLGATVLEIRVSADAGGLTTELAPADAAATAHAMLAEGAPEGGRLPLPAPAPAPAGPRPRLVVVDGGTPRTVPLRSDHVLIGRGPDSDVRVEHPSVSTRHAELARESGRWVLRDLNSRNGTRVGIQKVVGARELRNNAHIILGEADLLFVDDAPRAGTPANDHVLRMLERHRQLSRSQVQAARASLAAGEGQLGEVLVARGFLSPGQWTEALSEASSITGRPARPSRRMLVLALALAVLLLVLLYLLRARWTG